MRLADALDLSPCLLRYLQSQFPLTHCPVPALARPQGKPSTLAHAGHAGKSIPVPVQKWNSLHD